MGELASLPERLDAYLAIVGEDPTLDENERLRLFSYAVWPEKIERRPNYAHLMVCRDKFCAYCAGTGTVAA